ncbi:hypothetical protein [Streptomyces alkaliterrae]|uniref:Uncharacterized protein n=1 Tax=Streptomyces alkaliterrae TaxID=2213162 RepID=A0A5P0YTC9_9ACTN|nr:hypothetical protein [Streptomyces alkaliterrae]MBB1261443.1 hypothetical protein [Streptomyces alkaliterrae]MQS03573.1 hypothetical protein [Streptomyces alkaliterrae]
MAAEGPDPSHEPAPESDKRTSGDADCDRHLAKPSYRTTGLAQREYEADDSAVAVTSLAQGFEGRNAAHSMTFVRQFIKARQGLVTTEEEDTTVTFSKLKTTSLGEDSTAYRAKVQQTENGKETSYIFDSYLTRKGRT